MGCCVKFWPYKRYRTFFSTDKLSHVQQHPGRCVSLCNRFILLGLISTLRLSVCLSVLCLSNVSIGQRRQTAGTKAQYEFRALYEFPTAVFLKFDYELEVCGYRQVLTALPLYKKLHDPTG